MRHVIPTVLLASLVTAACSRPVRVESAGNVSPSVVPVDASGFPSGTTFDVRLDQQLGTKQSHVGDQFSATVANAIVASNGATVVPAGSKVYGHVTALQESKNVGETAAIRLDFDSLVVSGRSYPFNAQITRTDLQRRGETTNETLKKAGVGAVAGAALGAIISQGDLDKILLGGAIGAAAGTVISLGTGDVDAVLPAGSQMTLRATQSVALRY
jgi:hypothetical protein